MTRHTWTDGEEPGEAAPDELGLIGRGGMGEVHRVHDPELDRTVARKALLPELASRPKAVERFVAEARLTARLQHPGVVPVHVLGSLPDGRPCFTMREVQGRTLERVIADVHAGQPGWTFRRLIEALRTVCETVAYAHAQGVVHRDLKPDNVMVGAFGEVLVLDWGLAGADAQPGAISGTPSFMAPEQARGEADRIGPATDVYALGAVLFEILEGRPPFEGAAADVVRRVAGGERPRHARSGLPEPLVEATARAMAQEPSDRPTALGLAAELSAWLDGVRRRDEAVAVVEAALSRSAEPIRMRQEAIALRARAQAALDDVEPWAPEEAKAEGWALLDQAAAMERRANLAELEVAWRLAAALAVADDLPEARAALARHHRDALADAERRGDLEAAAREETLLALQVERLPADHPDRTDLQAWLRGEGTLEVHGDAATVTLERWDEQRRRLVAVSLGELGPTPVRATLPRGRYRLRLTAPGRAPALVPLRVERARPTREEPRLLDEGAIGSDEVYVPEGWFLCGGDPYAPNGLSARRVYVPAFVIARFPVTAAEYLAFLLDQTDLDDHLPRLTGETGSAWRRDGRVRIPEGWREDSPITHVSWRSARAFARWRSAQDGLPWRLPSEIEWEKAARGTDGRLWPWGDHGDPCWAAVAGSREEMRGPASVRDFDVDESPYGARGMGGNVREWCLEPWSNDGWVRDGERLVVDPDPAPSDRHTRRGGCWTSSVDRARACSRGKGHPDARREHLGFRLARSV